MNHLLGYYPAETVQASTCYIGYTQVVMGPTVFLSSCGLSLQEIFLEIFPTADSLWLISSMPAPQFGNVSFELFSIFNLHLNCFLKDLK